MTSANPAVRFSLAAIETDERPDWRNSSNLWSSSSVQMLILFNAIDESTLVDGSSSLARPFPGWRTYDWSRISLASQSHPCPPQAGLASPDAPRRPRPATRCRRSRSSGERGGQGHLSHGQPRGEGHLEGGGQVDRYSQALQEGATRGYAGRHYVARRSMPSHQASRQAHGDGVTAPSIARGETAPTLHRAVGSTPTRR